MLIPNRCIAVSLFWNVPIFTKWVKEFVFLIRHGYGKILLQFDGE